MVKLSVICLFSLIGVAYVLGVPDRAKTKKAPVKESVRLETISYRRVNPTDLSRSLGGIEVKANELPWGNYPSGQQMQSQSFGRERPRKRYPQQDIQLSPLEDQLIMDTFRPQRPSNKPQRYPPNRRPGRRPKKNPDEDILQEDIEKIIPTFGNPKQKRPRPSDKRPSRHDDRKPNQPPRRPDKNNRRPKPTLPSRQKPSTSDDNPRESDEDQDEDEDERPNRGEGGNTKHKQPQGGGSSRNKVKEVEDEDYAEAVVKDVADVLNKDDEGDDEEDEDEDDEDDEQTPHKSSHKEKNNKGDSQGREDQSQERVDERPGREDERPGREDELPEREDNSSGREDESPDREEGGQGREQEDDSQDDGDTEQQKKPGGAEKEEWPQEDEEKRPEEEKKPEDEAPTETEQNTTPEDEEKPGGEDDRDEEETSTEQEQRPPKDEELSPGEQETSPTAEGDSSEGSTAGPSENEGTKTGESDENGSHGAIDDNGETIDSDLSVQEVTTTVERSGDLEFIIEKGNVSVLCNETGGVAVIYDANSDMFLFFDGNTRSTIALNVQKNSAAVIPYICNYTVWKATVEPFGKFFRRLGPLSELQNFGAEYDTDDLPDDIKKELKYILGRLAYFSPTFPIPDADSIMTKIKDIVTNYEILEKFSLKKAADRFISVVEDTLKENFLNIYNLTFSLSSAISGVRAFLDILVPLTKEVDFSQYENLFHPEEFLNIISEFSGESYHNVDGIVKILNYIVNYLVGRMQFSDFVKELILFSISDDIPDQIAMLDFADDLLGIADQQEDLFKSATILGEFTSFFEALRFGRLIIGEKNASAVISVLFDGFRNKNFAPLVEVVKMVSNETDLEKNLAGLFLTLLYQFSGPNSEKLWTMHTTDVRIDPDGPPVNMLIEVFDTFNLRQYIGRAGIFELVECLQKIPMVGLLYNMTDEAIKERVENGSLAKALNSPKSAYEKTKIRTWLANVFCVEEEDILDDSDVFAPEPEKRQEADDYQEINITSLVNEEAHVALGIDPQKKMLALFNGFNRVTLIIDLKKNSGAMIAHTCSAAIWRASKSSFEDFLANITSLQKLAKTGEEFDLDSAGIHITKEMQRIWSLILNYMMKSPEASGKLSIIMNTINPTELFRDRRKKPPSQLITELRSEVGPEFLQKYGIALEYMPSLRSGFDSIVDVLSSVVDRANFAEELKKVLKMSEFLNFISEYSGESYNGFDGILKVMNIIVAYLDGSADFQSLLQGMIRFSSTDKKLKADQFVKELQGLLDVMQTQTETFNNEEDLREFIKFFEDLKGGNLWYKNVNISALIEITLEGTRSLGSSVKLVKLLSKDSDIDKHFTILFHALLQFIVSADGNKFWLKETFDVPLRARGSFINDDLINVIEAFDVSALISQTRPFNIVKIIKAMPVVGSLFIFLENVIFEETGQCLSSSIINPSAKDELIKIETWLANLFCVDKELLLQVSIIQEFWGPNKTTEEKDNTTRPKVDSRLELIVLPNNYLVALVNGAKAAAYVVDYKSSVSFVFNGNKKVAVGIGIGRDQGTYLNSKNPNVWDSAKQLFRDYLKDLNLQNLLEEGDNFEDKSSVKKVVTKQVREILAALSKEVRERLERDNSLGLDIMEEISRDIMKPLRKLDRTATKLVQGLDKGQRDFHGCLSRFIGLLNAYDLLSKTPIVHTNFDWSILMKKYSSSLKIFQILSKKVVDQLNFPEDMSLIFDKPVNLLKLLDTASSGSYSGLDGVARILFQWINYIEGNSNVSDVVKATVDYLRLAGRPSPTLQMRIKDMSNYMADMVKIQNKIFNNYDGLRTIDQFFKDLANQQLEVGHVFVSEMLKTLFIKDADLAKLIRIFGLFGKSSMPEIVASLFYELLNSLGTKHGIDTIKMLFPGMKQSLIIKTKLQNVVRKLVKIFKKPSAQKQARKDPIGTLMEVDMIKEMIMWLDAELRAQGHPPFHRLLTTKSARPEYAKVKKWVANLFSRNKKISKNKT